MKLRINCIFLFILALILLIYIIIKQNSYKEPKYHINLPSSPISEIQNNVISIIKDINQKNESIRSISSDKIDICINDRFINKVRGKLFYEKQNNFRLFITSVSGLEMDIGSNDKFIWFWSKRLKPTALYFAEQSDLHMTRLKTPFNPSWVKSVIGIEAIDYNEAFARKRGFCWEIFKKSTNLQGKPTIKSIIIDPQMMCVIGQYIYENNKLVCSSEVVSFIKCGDMNIPSVITIKWFDKQVISMTWYIKQLDINKEINNKNWVMPTYHKMIDMSKD